MDINYGFLGSGNMANAIIKGMIKNNIPKDKIYTYDIISDVLNKCVNDNNINKANSIGDLIQTCSVIVLCIKPNNFKEVLGDNRHYFKTNNNLIISIAAGITLNNIRDYLGYDVKAVRVMPNLNASVLESMTAVCKNKVATENDLQIALKMFNSVGKTEVIKEKLFGTFSAIAASSPAFTFLYIDFLAKAAVRAGFNKQFADFIVSQSVLGSAKLLLESGENPQVLIDKVCSPGGTTIEGILSLYENGFNNALIKAIDDTIKKESTLNKN